MGISKYASKEIRHRPIQRLHCITFERGDKKLVIEDYFCHPDSVPTPYDVLASSQRRDPESFEDFCLNFGYDNDSMHARFIWKSTTEQFESFRSFFTSEELKIIAEIW